MRTLRCWGEIRSQGLKSRKSNDYDTYFLANDIQIEELGLLFLLEAVWKTPFHTDRLLDTKWHLGIRSVEERKLLYSIHRDKRVNHSWYPVDVIFEISFLDPDGSAIVSRKQRKCFDSVLYYEFILEDAFESERARFIVNDTLTIRCRMWSADGKCFRIILPNQCFIHIRLAIERTILWYARALSEGRAGRPGVKYRLPHLSQTGHYVITVNLKITPNEDGERILITILEDNLPQRLAFDISVLDIDGKKRFRSKFTRYHLRNEEVYRNLMAIVKEEFMNCKEFILFDDMLCVRCEFEIENGPARDDPCEYKRSEVLK
ncbi:uncharacterized protein TNIN_139411 [Trichonephila inaurata madagascariensis]|uniref:Uncharacterized protein n=1 Tax=Trichonephila inaurata madagascariensis TaxID=2747483 RepID=A0A8X7BUW0_9ARAC|nr:uncharacterized protein TNIN_139411 [Trichonephila inaurata madagascariensis]